MADLLTGKEVVAHLKENMEGRIAALNEKGIVPTLALIRVGAREDDLSYERTARKRAEGLGIGIRLFELAADATQDEIIDAVHAVNDDSSIHGCLMFLPLPKGIDESAVRNELAPEKDIDGITLGSMAGVFSGQDLGYAPATAAACLEVLDFYGIDACGKHVVVVGRSLVIGKPVSLMLQARNATVTMCHSKTTDLAAMTRQADIVILAIGRGKMFTADYFSDGQIVLDVGINFVDGALCGDMDAESAGEVVGAYTPVPGGLGTVTTSVTMLHTVIAAEKAAK